jgi:hypothetical protein
MQILLDQEKHHYFTILNKFSKNQEFSKNIQQPYKKEQNGRSIFYIKFPGFFPLEPSDSALL